MIREKITLSEFNKNAEIHSWNAMIDISTMNDFDDLSKVQKVAYLVFWYDSEVNNGGHLQFTLNIGEEAIPQTINALGQIQANVHKKILSDYYLFLQSNKPSEIETKEEYVEEALQGKYSVFDDRYLNSQSSLDEVLATYVLTNQFEFIEICDEPVAGTVKSQVKKPWWKVW